MNCSICARFSVVDTGWIMKHTADRLQHRTAASSSRSRAVAAIAMLPLTWSHNASPIQGWAPRRWKAERPRRRDGWRRSGPPPCSRHRLRREEWRVRRACWLAGSRWSEVPYKEDIGGPEEKGKQWRRVFLLLVNLIETADITAAASLWLQLLATYFWVAIESNGYTQLTQLQLH